MRTLLALAVFGLMNTILIAGQSSAFITDPQQVTSRVRPDVPSFDLEKLYLTRLIGATAWSPVGKQIVFVANISGRNNLWLMPATGTWPVQFTVSNQRQTAPAWSPDGKSIAFMSDYDGDEQWNLFLSNARSGEVVNLTKTKDISEESPVWSPDGKWLAYIVKPRTSSNYESIYSTLPPKKSVTLLPTHRGRRTTSAPSGRRMATRSFSHNSTPTARIQTFS